MIIKDLADEIVPIGILGSLVVGSVVVFVRAKTSQDNRKDYVGKEECRLIRKDYPTFEEAYNKFTPKTEQVSCKLISDLRINDAFAKINELHARHETDISNLKDIIKDYNDNVKEIIRKIH